MKYGILSMGLCSVLLLGTLGQEFVSAEEMESVSVVMESPYSDFVFTNGVITKYVGSGGDVVIPAMLADQKVVKIGDSAFLNQTSVTSVVLPEHLQEVERMAFFGCSKLEEVVFPSGLAVIGDFAFTGCISLQEVDLPFSLEGIGRSGFSGSGLVSLSLPDSLTTLGSSAFSGCLSLDRVYFGNSLAVVPSSAFSRCSRLYTVILGYGVTKIESGAFQYCRQLSEMAVMNRLATVEAGAFHEVEPLEKIYYTGNYNQMSGIQIAGDTLVDGSWVSNHGLIFGNWIYESAYPSGGDVLEEAEDDGFVWEEDVEIEQGSGLDVSTLYDVSASDWYYPYVALVYESGYMGEVSGGNFRPEMLGTRGMIALSLYGIGQEKVGSAWEESGQSAGNFADVPLEYAEAVAWCYEHGVMMGISEDFFGTVSPVTREQFALVLRQLARVLGDAGAISDPEGLGYFFDVESVSDWAAEGLVWAVEQGLMKGFEGYLNPQGSVTRSEMAVMLYQFVQRF